MKTILLVDDDPISLEVSSQTLRSLGHDVVPAPDGETAWGIFQRQPIQIIVSDWKMPGVDGLTLCKMVREAAQSDYTYFILVSGAMTTQKHYLKAMEEGMDDFLLKPLDREVLFIRLRVAERILGFYRRIKQLEGIIPICAYCRRVRRDDNVYQTMEDYIEEHSRSQFSHGICPDCVAKHFKNKPPKT
jgi:sigma-B regulation protein RsbU (phosphoserine phosphatase)